MPLDIRNDIRSMDADGVSRSEIARRLHVSRNTVSKYADMEDMSPVAPVRRARERPGLEGNGPWIEKVLARTSPPLASSGTPPVFDSLEVAGLSVGKFRA